MIDIQYGLKSLGDNKHLFLKLRQSFLDNYKDFTNEVEFSFKNKKYMHYLIHTLKGFTKNLGMMELHEACILIIDKILKHKCKEEDVSFFCMSFDKSYQAVLNLNPSSF